MIDNLTFNNSMKKHNFSAGPSILPQFTVNETAKAVLDFNNSGLSIMEISHRSKAFEAVLDETLELTREVLSVPDGYSVLYLGGGASLQFCMVPINLFEKKAAYLNTGIWASKAINEAKGFGEIIEVASSKANNYSYIPKNYVIPSDVDYFHITANNTIYGTALKDDPEVDVLLVADMSSYIFSRPMDISRYGLIYASAQKNLSCAGVTLIIVKNDILGKVSRHIPMMLDYRAHIKSGSMYNTPPVLPIYVALQSLKWIIASGGLVAMQKHNETKAAILYDEIDRNTLFKGTAAKEDRSLMNARFVMNDEYKHLEDDFHMFAQSRGIVDFKGHSSVGGFRASIYNALPIESVQALVDCMKEYEQKI
jgi:phosphoserine aminotransferase